MDDMTFGERLTLIRRRRHMTQNQLAAVLGVTHTEIHRLETGLVKDPHMSRVMALARALHVTTDWLLGMSPDLEET
jgi:transcriptional regulator with XRE-family HTH domain